MSRLLFPNNSNSMIEAEQVVEGVKYTVIKDLGVGGTSLRMKSKIYNKFGEADHVAMSDKITGEDCD